MKTQKVNMEWLFDIIKSCKEAELRHFYEQYEEGLITEPEYDDLQDYADYAVEAIQRLEDTIKDFIEETNKI
jgi:hypothetical protein